MAKISKKEKNIELYKAILSLKNLDECCRFFEDLCTVPELRAMEQRYEVASLLNQGLIYNDILEKTGASSATISRVNRSLNYGAGGYEDVFRNLAEQNAEKDEADDIGQFVHGAEPRDPPSIARFCVARPSV